MPIRSGSASILAIAVGLSIAATPASGQATTPAGPVKSGADGAGSNPGQDQSPAANDQATGDIIVTATRRSESLQRVPLMVTALSETQLRTANIADTRDIGRLVPALQYVQGSSTKLTFFSVRGVGSYINSDGFDQSVAIAFDGVPLARPAGSIADLVDLDHVEVLEGPQGMLFGKNASAGLVNIITKMPKMGETGAEARISYGSYNELQTSGTVNLPLASNVALRATGWRFRHDGYVDADRLSRTLGVKNSYGGRLRLRWQPGAGTDVNLSGEWTGADQDPAVLTIRDLVTNAQGVRAYELAAGTVPGPDNYRTTSTTDIFNKAHSSAYTLQIDQDAGSGVATALTSYRKVHNREVWDPDSTDAPLFGTTQRDRVDSEQFSQELRLSSGPGGRLRYVVGLIYFRLSLHDRYGLSGIGTAALPLSYKTDVDLTSEHYAAFAELTFDITRTLRVIAGGRASHDHIAGALDRNYDAIPTTIIASVNGPTTSFGPFSARSSVSADQPSYRFGVQYDVAPDVRAYVTASRGYKAPGLDFVATANPAAFALDGLRVRPEIAKNYEIGLRAQLFDRRLTVNLTAFSERFTDFQTSVRLPGAAVVFATRNAGELRSDGIEGNLSVTLLRGVTLSGSAAYIHARYTDFANAACYPGEPSAPVGTPAGPNLCIGGVQSLDGVALANSPRFSGNLSLRYADRIALHPVFVQWDGRHQSRVLFNTSNDPREQQNGYETLNFAAGIRTVDERFGLGVYAKNLFDTHYVSRTVQLLSGAYYVQTHSYEARRTIGVALDARF